MTNKQTPLPQPGGADSARLAAEGGGPCCRQGRRSHAGAGSPQVPRPASLASSSVLIFQLPLRHPGVGVDGATAGPGGVLLPGHESRGQGHASDWHSAQVTAPTTSPAPTILLLLLPCIAQVQPDNLRGPQQPRVKERHRRPDQDEVSGRGGGLAQDRHLP